MKIGIPKEYKISGLSSEVENIWNEGIKWMEDAGAEIVEVTLPHTKYALPTYYIVACLLYTSPSPRDLSTSRMPSSA